MKKPGNKSKMPKERNFAAAAVRDPNGPFRPKSIPRKNEKPLDRKRKHKGKPLNNA
jgi:hypothetical protein